MKFKDIKKYLYSSGFIVKNEEYEYKAKGEVLYCRQIGCETWNFLYRMPEYEKEMDWEVVGLGI